MEAPRKSVHLYYFLNNFYVNNRILIKFKDIIWRLVVIVYTKNELSSIKMGVDGSENK